MNAGLTVWIETDPASEPYAAATWIEFGCFISGNTSMVTFNWTYLCNSHSPPTIVHTFTNRTTINESDVLFPSTDTTCLDSMLCSASDQSGNSGSASWRLGRVTGQLLFI